MRAFLISKEVEDYTFQQSICVIVANLLDFYLCGRHLILDCRLTGTITLHSMHIASLCNESSTALGDFVNCLREHIAFRRIARKCCTVNRYLFDRVGHTRRYIDDTYSISDIVIQSNDIGSAIDRIHNA